MIELLENITALGEQWVDAILLLFMVLTALGVLLVRSLFGSVMLMGVFSLLSAALFVVLDAVDVAFTEAAVGAGITVVLFLSALALMPGSDVKPVNRPVTALAVCLAAGTLLIGGTTDMPLYGDPQAPAQTHVAPRYVEEGKKETGVPNMVTAVLASYRGYDTLGEVVVVFTAAAGVMLLLGGGLPARRREDGES
ncbi:MAG: DUF4040 domain-containing protein [Alphaproteobacteria bacterium]